MRLGSENGGAWMTQDSLQEASSIKIRRVNPWIASVGFLLGLAFIILFALGFVLNQSDPNWWFVLLLVLIGFGMILLSLGIGQSEIQWFVSDYGIRELIEPAFRISFLVRRAERLVPWSSLSGFKIGEQHIPYGRSTPQFKLVANTGTVLSISAVEVRGEESFDEFIQTVCAKAKQAGLSEISPGRGFLRSVTGRVLSALLLVGLAYFVYLDLVAVDAEFEWSGKERFYLVVAPFILWMASRSFR